MTNEVQKIIDEGKTFGFTVTQGEHNAAFGEVWIDGEFHKFGSNYKVEGFNWKQVIEDYARESYSEGLTDGQRW